MEDSALAIGSAQIYRRDEWPNRSVSAWRKAQIFTVPWSAGWRQIKYNAASGTRSWPGLRRGGTTRRLDAAPSVAAVTLKPTAVH